MMSDSFMIRRSRPSILTSVPDHLPKRTLSPIFTSMGVSLPPSSRPPGPTAIISPSWGFSLAVSGMMIPPFVFSSPSRRRTTLNQLYIKNKTGAVKLRDAGERSPSINGVRVLERHSQDQTAGFVHDLEPTAIGKFSTRHSCRKHFAGSQYRLFARSCDGFVLLTLRVLQKVFARSKVEVKARHVSSFVRHGTIVTPLLGFRIIIIGLIFEANLLVALRACPHSLSPCVAPWHCHQALRPDER